MEDRLRAARHHPRDDLRHVPLRRARDDRADERDAAANSRRRRSASAQRSGRRSRASRSRGARWAILNGVLLCNARALGEFGAVSVISGNIRGLTNTVPLHIDVLYNSYNLVGAFTLARRPGARDDHPHLHPYHHRRPHASADEHRNEKLTVDSLDRLEAETITILREAYRASSKPCMLWSIGKDSTALLWMARKAFLGRVPFPMVLLETFMELPEVYEFRDELIDKWQLEYFAQDLPARERSRPDAAAGHARGRAQDRRPAHDAARAEVRRRDRRHPARRAGDARERARVQPAPHRRHVGRERAAAGVLGLLHDQRAGRRAPARASAAVVDRTRHLGVHAAREHSVRAALSRARRQTLSVARGEEHHRADRQQRRSTIEEIIAELRATRVPERAGRTMDNESEASFERLRAGGYM